MLGVVNWNKLHEKLQAGVNADFLSYVFVSSFSIVIINNLPPILYYITKNLLKCNRLTFLKTCSNFPEFSGGLKVSCELFCFMKYTHPCAITKPVINLKNFTMIYWRNFWIENKFHVEKKLLYKHNMTDHFQHFFLHFKYAANKIGN